MENKYRKKMPISERAKQFAPFSALAGLSEALCAKEKVVVEKIELCEDAAEELNRKMQALQKGTLATIIYFSHNEYLKITGMVARIEQTSRLLQIVNTKIPFDNILDIKIP